MEWIIDYYMAALSAIDGFSARTLDVPWRVLASYFIRWNNYRNGGGEGDVLRRVCVVVVQASGNYYNLIVTWIITRDNIWELADRVFRQENKSYWTLYIIEEPSHQ